MLRKSKALANTTDTPYTNSVVVKHEMKLNNLSMLLHSSASLASTASLTTSSDEALGSFRSFESEKRNTAGNVLAVSSLASTEIGDL